MTFFARTTLEETALIDKIAERNMADPERSPYANKMTAMIEFILTHCNGTPLALEALITADRASFWHDVIGIARNLDRKTGKLANTFTPRHALH